MAPYLGDPDVIEMLTMFTELDQSYEGFRPCRKSLENTLSDRDANKIIKQALDKGMNF